MLAHNTPRRLQPPDRRDDFLRLHRPVHALPDSAGPHVLRDAQAGARRPRVRFARPLPDRRAHIRDPLADGLPRGLHPGARGVHPVPPVHDGLLRVPPARRQAVREEAGRLPGLRGRGPVQAAPASGGRGAGDGGGHDVGSIVLKSEKNPAKMPEVFLFLPSIWTPTAQDLAQDRAPCLCSAWQVMQENSQFVKWFT